MKYMIMMFGSQQDYDVLTGTPTDKPAWTPAEIAAMHEFMGAWNNELVDSGEFVAGHGLAAPVHTRRVRVRDGAPVVTDGPYPETQEVLAGYTIVEVASYDRAVEIASRLSKTPHPEHANETDFYVDIRPVIEGVDELELP